MLLRSKQHSQELAEAYFELIKNDFHIEQETDKTIKTDGKEADRKAEPALLTGLALHLGFNSLPEFETYAQRGKYATVVKRARLRVEAEYERKLHIQPPTGAIFALKSMGWADKTDAAFTGEDMPASLRIEIIETGPVPAGTEKEVEIRLLESAGPAELPK